MVGAGVQSGETEPPRLNDLSGGYRAGGMTGSKPIHTVGVPAATSTTPHPATYHALSVPFPNTPFKTVPMGG